MFTSGSWTKRSMSSGCLPSRNWKNPPRLMRCTVNVGSTEPVPIEGASSAVSAWACTNARSLSLIRGLAISENVSPPSNAAFLAHSANCSP